MQYRGFFKKYLERVGFDLKAQKARFSIRLWVDTMAATTYSIVSILLIAFQKADLVVLGLNILCLLRATINSMICASEVTNRIRGSDIEKKHTINNHYRFRAGILTMSFIYTTIVWSLLSFYEYIGELYYGSSSDNVIISLIKVLTSIAILLVLYNDIENNLVCAYDASINLEN